MLALEVPLRAESLESAQDRIERHLEAAGVSARARYKVRLVLDEVVANLMMHGRFAGAAAPLRVEVTAADGVLLAIEDPAEPFDPREAPAARATTREGDDIGGLGLPLVRRMAEIRAYHAPRPGWNRLELAIGDG